MNIARAKNLTEEGLYKRAVNALTSIGMAENDNKTINELIE